MEMPQKGFYIHYKYDPNGAAHNYTYELVGVGKNTEDDTLCVIYRPLYKNEWLAPAEYNCRPLEMFTENVEKDGVSMPRFRLVTDPALITELENVRDTLYGA